MADKFVKRYFVTVSNPDGTIEFVCSTKKGVTTSEVVTSTKPADMKIYQGNYSFEQAVQNVKCFYGGREGYTYDSVQWHEAVGDSVKSAVDHAHDIGRQMVA
jgi:hypothetical protein